MASILTKYLGRTFSWKKGSFQLARQGNAFSTFLKELWSFLHDTTCKTVVIQKCFLVWYIMYWNTRVKSAEAFQAPGSVSMLNSRGMFHDPGWSWIRSSGSEAVFVFISAREPHPHVTEILLSIWSVCVCSVWHWGQVSVYSSAGFVQDLSRKMQDSRALVKQLNTHQWLDPLWVNAHTQRKREINNQYILIS